MAIEIVKATELSKTSGVKVLLYGASGLGKTSQFKHTGKTILISLESGELVLSDAKNVDVVRVSNLAEIREAYEYVKANKDKYDTVGIDSLSELSEVIVAELKKMPEYSDPRDTFKLWGKYTELMLQIAKSFRDLNGINVVLVALDESVKNGFEEKIMPSVAAKKAQGKLPSLYDEVLYLRATENDEREFVCHPTADVVAKDRSGKLDPIEPCSREKGIEHIFKKITGDK
jgi:phage nucleotide-binding protein